MAERGAREQAQATEGDSPGRDNLRRWIKFAQRLLTLCNEILKASNVQPGEKGFAEPKVLALAVLCRTYLNLKGVIAVANEGLVVEARTLARSCCENLIFAAALKEKEDKFVTAMRVHDLRSHRSQVEFILGDLDPFEAEFAKLLQRRLREMKKLRPNAKTLNVKEIACDSVIKPVYLFYGQLSADAAHPSLTALRRHLFQSEENGERVWGLAIQPVESSAEAADTVNIACKAVLGVCVAVNELLGCTTANALLNQLAEEYSALAGIRAQPA